MKSMWYFQSWGYNFSLGFRDKLFSIVATDYYKNKNLSTLDNNNNFFFLVLKYLSLDAILPSESHASLLPQDFPAGMKYDVTL